MRTRLAVVSLLALLVAGGAAQAAPDKAAAPKRQCFYARDVNGFRAPNDKVVYLRVGVRDVYQADLFAPCPDVQWHEGIALVSRGTRWICSGLDVDIISPSVIGPQRCPLRNLHKLSPAEIAALPKKALP